VHADAFGTRDGDERDAGGAAAGTSGSAWDRAPVVAAAAGESAWDLTPDVAGESASKPSPAVG